jgi:hypothetical protein
MANSEFAPEFTWGRVLRIWWAWFWRAGIFSVVLGFLLGAIGGFIVGASGRPDLGAPVGAALGGLGSVPVSLFVLGIVLRKRYRQFSIKVVPHGAG